MDVIRTTTPKVAGASVNFAIHTYRALPNNVRRQRRGNPRGAHLHNEQVFLFEIALLFLVAPRPRPSANARRSH